MLPAAHAAHAVAPRLPGDGTKPGSQGAQAGPGAHAAQVEAPAAEEVLAPQMRHSRPPVGE